MLRTAMWVAGLLVVLAGCGDEAGAGGGPDLRGKTFLSTAVTEDGKPKQLVPNTRIRLQFMDDGRLVADAGCNTMGGEVDTGGGVLDVKDLSVTEMGCDRPRHAQDDWLAGLLQGKPRWELRGDRLDLTSGTTTVVLQDRRTAQPDRALDGTKWIVESLIKGETASTPGGHAYLTVNGERVTGSTGCNEFQGVVTRAPGRLTFGDLVATRRACTGTAAALEKTILTVLSGEVTYQITADRLTLRTPTGDGLDLKAT